jgi:hypothetical protein
MDLLFLFKLRGEDPQFFQMAGFCDDLVGAHLSAVGNCTLGLGLYPVTMGGILLKETHS